jgi:hypothetical protein
MHAHLEKPGGHGHRPAEALEIDVDDGIAGLNAEARALGLVIVEKRVIVPVTEGNDACCFACPVAGKIVEVTLRPAVRAHVVNERAPASLPAFS